ncbi:MAG: V-type ATP synthase subunit A [Candidatus Palauibacterales bacterium]|nr:V-type ATP synthase subunit A [Candidatus Palauibacterales bacterium]
MSGADGGGRDGAAEARVTRVAGALVEAAPLPAAALYEQVLVGESGLAGEVIRTRGEIAVVQLFEDSDGLELGEPVERTGSTLTAELGPGLLGSVLDGVGRPLELIADETGPFIEPGSSARTLDRERTWAFTPERSAGEEVAPGDVLGHVRETPEIAHQVLVPRDGGGILAGIDGGEYAVDEPIGRMEDGRELTLLRRWPVRRPRPAGERLPADRPFVTGQRVFDLLFPVAEGGSVSVPGGFGTGKTVVEQTLARYGDADVIVYVGCGERGNEMAELLSEFPELEDPRTGRPLMERTVLVVNTSNMPVVAREASVYLGITIAEYYRDMGLRVALLADSISRWAEALREISSRLQEMPGEEGYPTYLADRLGKIYERSGRVRVPGSPERAGALTLITAVSPPGGDFSEPVTQASLRVAGGVWALDSELANQRHYPAVDWETSYSLYEEQTGEWFAGEVAPDWPEVRRDALELLDRERDLREIVNLVGPESLEDDDRLLLEAARMLRELVLAQNAFDPVDAYSPPEKTHLLTSLILDYRRAAADVLEEGVEFVRLKTGPVREAVRRVRQAPEDELDERARRAQELVAEVPRGEPAGGTGKPTDEAPERGDDGEPEPPEEEGGP